jgi:hypothetical protein
MMPKHRGQGYLCELRAPPVSIPALFKSAVQDDAPGDGLSPKHA